MTEQAKQIEQADTNRVNTETTVIRNATFNMGIDPAFSITLQVNFTSELDMKPLMVKALKLLLSEIEQHGFGFMQPASAGHTLRYTAGNAQDTGQVTNDLQKRDSK